MVMRSVLECWFTKTMEPGWKNRAVERAIVKRRPGTNAKSTNIITGSIVSTAGQCSKAANAS
jgi:hypothetical protein